MKRISLSPTQLSLALALVFSIQTSAVMASGVADKPAPSKAEAQLIAKAKRIHDKVLTLDTHDDIDLHNFDFSRNYSQDLESQVNLPKMISGGLDASFFIVYTGQSKEADAFETSGYKRAYDSAIAMFEGIHRLTTVFAPGQIAFARTAEEVRKIAASGKKVALIGVENAYPLGDEKSALRNLKQFYQRGARYMSLAHQGHSQFSDSNTGEQSGWKWHGLSELGKQMIPEMNKLGIMVDVSHPSKASMMQTLALTKAPIIASHSSVRALCDVSRNMDDEQLLALKENGGVIQIVGFGSYLKTDSAERRAALKALRQSLQLDEQFNFNALRRANPSGMSEERRAQILDQLAQLDQKFPPPSRASVKDLVDHIDYAVKKIGIDHVGIASDFDGGGGIEGWNHAGETLNVTVELVRRGYDETQIAKLWSGNLLRVMAEVEKVARSLQKSAL